MPTRQAQLTPQLVGSPQSTPASPFTHVGMSHVTVHVGFSQSISHSAVSHST